MRLRFTVTPHKNMKLHLPLCLALASLTTLTTMTARAEDDAKSDKKAPKKEKKAEVKKAKGTASTK